MVERITMNAPTSSAPAGAPPSPVIIFDALNGYQRSAALRAAIELEVFSVIGRGERTAGAIGRACGAAERGVRILCDYLVVIGLLTKSGETYHLTPDSAAFLDKRSPAYMGGAVRFMHGDTISAAFAKLTDAVRNGGTAVPADGTVAPDHPVWVDFARGMAPLMAMPAELLAALVDPTPARPLKVLDISASHGLYGLAFARRNPAARVVGNDWPTVLKVAQESAERMGVADRFSTIPGSAFEVDFGRDYDIVLLPNFLHHFDAAGCEKLLRKVHTALKAGGRVVVLEFIPEPDRVSPPPSAMFALTMLATTPSGDAYTYAEYEAMLRNAGYARSELHPLPPTMQRVVIGYKHAVP
jgi:SAM-dependent methyltransferase